MAADRRVAMKRLGLRLKHDHWQLHGRPQVSDDEVDALAEADWRARSDFTRAFRDAGRTFRQFKSDVEGQAIRVRLDDRGLADARRSLSTRLQDLSPRADSPGLAPQPVSPPRMTTQEAVVRGSVPALTSLPPADLGAFWQTWPTHL